MRAARGGACADLVAVFATPDLMTGADRSPRHVIGCTVEGVNGTGREVEEGPWPALWAAPVSDLNIGSFAPSAAEA